MKFSQLAKSLKEELSPVYLIEGEEAYFRDHAVSAIRAACEISQPTLNDVRLDGETLKGDKLVAFRDDLYTLPFFDNKRLVRVYEFYPTEREWESVMKGYCEKPCETTVLVLINRGKKAFAADLKKKNLTVVDCAKEEKETLERWLYALLRRAGVEADVDAVSLMVSYCNQDCARMKVECDKLKLLLGEGGRLTRNIVEEYVAKDVEYNIYELTQAASRKNFSQFSEVLSELMNKGYDEYAALAALTSHYRTLTEIAGLKGTDAEIAKIIGSKPYPVQKNRELISRLGAERVRELYRRLFELSCGAKQGTYGKTNAVYAAIAEIFFG